MPRRIKLNPVISIGHHEYTGMIEATRASDAPHVRVEVAELPWLHRVEIEFDAKEGTVRVSVRLTDENAANGPDLRVRADASFEVRS